MQLNYINLFLHICHKEYIIAVYYNIENLEPNLKYSELCIYTLNLPYVGRGNFIIRTLSEYVVFHCHPCFTPLKCIKQSVTFLCDMKGKVFKQWRLWHLRKCWFRYTVHNYATFNISLKIDIRQNSFLSPDLPWKHIYWRDTSWTFLSSPFIVHSDCSCMHFRVSLAFMKNSSSIPNACFFFFFFPFPRNAD